MPTAIDLKTLDLDDGTYNITVQAEGAGYRDSKPSNSVSYTATATISGVWKFNESVLCTEDIVQNITFSSNSTQYIRMRVKCVDNGVVYYDYSDYDDDIAYDKGWTRGNEYMTVDFGVEPQRVSRDFYNFIVANATIKG